MLELSSWNLPRSKTSSRSVKGTTLHSRHKASSAATWKQGPSCRNISPVTRDCIRSVWFLLMMSCLALSFSFSSSSSASFSSISGPPLVLNFFSDGSILPPSPESRLLRLERLFPTSDFILSSSSSNSFIPSTSITDPLLMTSSQFHQCPF